MLNFLFCTVPSGSPRNVLVTAMSSTSILVTWDSPLESEQNGVIISYTVAYVNLNRSGDQQISLSTTQRQLSITGLQEYEEYSFTVAATTTVGQGPFSDTSSTFTFQDGKHIVARAHKKSFVCAICNRRCSSFNWPKQNQR